MPKTSSSMPQNLTRMNPGAAAIDIGSTMHMAAVISGLCRDTNPLIRDLHPRFA